MSRLRPVRRVMRACGRGPADRSPGSEWMRYPCNRIGWAAVIAVMTGVATFGGESIDVPRVEGEWWQIAPNAPDVGKWSTGKENACDFAIFRSSDGKWHCIACIRGTSHYGQRLFYRWEADHLTDTDWRPCGMFEVPRGKRGKPPEFTSVQAPHPVVHDGKYYLFYNSGTARCMISRDGREWRPHVNTDGHREFFPMGRDVCVFHDTADRRWIAYYCGTVNTDGKRKGAMVARTAPSPEGPWSDKESAVRTAGNPESPYVIKRGEWYYLWQQMSVYRAADPLDFDNAELIAHMTGIWYSGKWAPEVIEHEGRFYIAGYGRGIHVALLEWEGKTPDQVAAWRKRWNAYLAEEHRKRLEREEQRRKQKADEGSGGVRKDS